MKRAIDRSFLRIWSLIVHFPFDGNWQERCDALAALVGRMPDHSRHSRIYAWYSMKGERKFQEAKKRIYAAKCGVPTVAEKLLPIPNPISRAV